MRLGRRVAAWAATLSMAAILLTPGAVGAVAGASSPRTPADEEESTTVRATLDVELDGVEPTILMEGDEAEITVSVTNTSNETIENATVHLNAQGWTPNSRSTLLLWLDPTRYDPSYHLGTEVIDLLPAGATTTVTFEVPSAGFGFNTWGPRGIEVVARADGVVVDRDRTYVLWWNEPSVVATRVGVLAPVTRTWGELQSGANERLDELEALDGAPGLTLLVDPSLRTGTLSEFASLPWLNADSDALLANDPDRYAAAVERSRAARPTAPVVAWLTTPSAPTVESASSMADAVLFPSNTVSGAQDPEYTPSAVIENSSTPIAMIDSGLTEVLDGYVTVEETTYTLNDVQRRQLLAAVTSVITRESPLDGHTVLGALSMDATADDAAIVDLLAEAPWVEPVALADALESAASGLEMDLPAEAEIPADAISLEELASAATISEAITELSTLSPDVESRLVSSTTHIDFLTSRAMRGEPAARTRTLDRAAWVVDYYQRGVSVTGPSEVNMISSESEFPVIVTNTLPHAVTVAVTLAPTDRRLQSPNSVESVIPSGTTSRVMVPVKGVGWGDFTAVASVSTTTGHQLSHSYIIDIRLRANWEDWGLIGIILIAVAALAFGIWRTVRRNRRIHRSEIIDAAAVELDLVLEAERTGRRASRREP